VATAEHAHQMGTGGGPPLPPRPADPLLDRVRQIVPYIALEVSNKKKVIIITISNNNNNQPYRSLTCADTDCRLAQPVAPETVYSPTLAGRRSKPRNLILCLARAGFEHTTSSTTVQRLTTNQPSPVPTKQVP